MSDSQSVHELLSVLQSKNCRQEDTCSAYVYLAKKCEGGSMNLSTQELREYSSELIKIITRDLSINDDAITKNVLNILLYFLQDDSVGSSKNSASVLTALMKCMKQAKTVEVLKATLQCLVHQQFSDAKILSSFSSILDLIEETSSKLKAMSVSPIEELTSVFTKLDNQCHSGMMASVARWGRLVFPGLASVSQGVRDRSLALLQEHTEGLNAAQDMRKHIIKAIGAGLAKSLKTLIVKYEEHVLSAWSLIVTVAGKDLHKGPAINALLEVIEMGFKGTPESRSLSFIAWRSLINNFALDQGIISDPKRIKLIMMVLKVDNAKTEPVALEKLKTWWHFVMCIGPKRTVNFDQILTPLLHFCVGSKLCSESSVFPALSLAKTQSEKMFSQITEFPELQRKTFEIIYHILACTGKHDKELSNLYLEKIPQDVFSGTTFFLKHAPMLILAIQELLLKGFGESADEPILLAMWSRLVSHLHVAMEMPGKAEARDVFSSFLSLLRVVVEKQLLHGGLVLQLLEVSSKFPPKVLASTAYSIPGGPAIRSSAPCPPQACPALMLIEVMMTDYVLVTGRDDSIERLFGSLVQGGASNSQGALVFLQSVCGLLQQGADQWSQGLGLWRMWEVVAQTLLATINTTNEVNQGDSLEYNFGGVLAVLLFPIQTQLPIKVYYYQSAYKSLSKLWKEIYHSFARLAALVTTAEANACMEDLCAKVMQAWVPEFESPMLLEFLSIVCQKCVDSIDFSGMAQVQHQLILSPSKWARRRQKPLGHLHSLVHLLTKVQEELNTHLGGTDLAKQLSCSLILIAHNLVDTYIHLFSHVTSNGVITHIFSAVAMAMGRLYGSSTHVSVKLFVPSFLTKLERLWQEVCGCITGRFNGQYDSDFLEALSPLLEATFVHSRRAIKNQTHTMWSTTFARAGTLNYPDKLKPVLSKVKEKTNLSLPGWVMQAVVVAETPSSEMSMGGESQVSQVPLLAPTVSPSKLMRGSMLHRSPSPKPSPVPSKSPVKTVAPKDAKNIFSSIWNKMAADSLKDEDFVVISSPSAKKKMVLTDHQREMMKEKRVLPAMYNNLDASQDVSLMAQFATENTQQSTQSLFASISSKCLENGDKTKAAPASTSEKNTEPSSLVTKAVGDALPTRNSTSDMKMPSTPTRSRRKSVRISELQHEPQEISPKRDKERIVGLSVLNHNERKSRLSSYEDKVKEDSIKQNSDNKVENVVEAENSEEDIVRSSLESDASPTKPDINVDKKSEDDKEDVPNLDAPFVMFRSKETITVSPKPFSLSQDGAKKEPRRISLRKIHSQNDMSSESAKPEEFGACDQKEEVKKVPRRVPLQKLSEPLNEEAKVNFPALSPAKPQKSNLEKWIVKQQKDVSTEENIKDKLRKSDIEFETSNNDNNKVQTESHTLVEDTQSPHKVLSAKRHSEREQDRSVAETPTKNETGPLPILRSVRKLFLDKESDEDKEEPIRIDSKKDKEEPTRIDSKKDKEEPTRIDSKKEKEVEPLPLQVYSALSQGFDIKKVSNTQKESNVHDSFGFSQLEEEACDNPLNKEKSQSLFAEDEIKSINNQEDEIMSPEFKSTLASQPPIFRFKTYSKSSSSEDSERLTESETNTISSSAEPDFNPALPTMDIDGAKSTPNKRKRQTPKKYSPEKRLRRASVKHNTPHTEIEIQNKDVVTVEEDETSTAFIEIKVVEPSPKKQAPTSLENKAEEKLVSSAERERLLTASSKEDSLLTASSKKESKFNSVSEPEIEQLTPGKSIEDSQEMTKLKKSKESPEIIGEITPDMKSPSNATPSRRYSQAKRLRNSKLKCHSEPKRILHKKREAKKTSLDFGINGNSDNEMISDSNNTSVLSSLGKDQSPIKKIKKMSPMSVGRKPRHMLKSRVKGKRSLSSLSPSSSPPPNKLRKLTVDSQSENSEEVVKKKRGRPKKQPKTNISFSEDDDVPLSQLSSKEKEINVLEEVVEEPTKLVNESEKVVKESTTVVNETEVAVKQSTTVVNETEVVVKESTTVVNETEAVVNEAETAVNQHSSEEEDDSVPLIKLLVKPQKLSVKSQENKGDKKVDKVSNDEIKDVYIDEAKLDSTNDKCNTESQVPLFMSESDDVFTEDMPPAAQQIMSPEVSGTSSSSSNSSGQTEGSGAASSDQLQASSTDIVMSGSEVNHLHLSMSNQTPQDQEDMDTESTCPPSASDLFLSLSKQTEEEENNLSESKKDKPLSESSIEEKSIGLTSAVEETSTSISSKNELNSNSLSLKTFNAPEIVGEKAANESKDISNTSNETAMEVENSSEGVVLSAVPPETSQALHDWSPGKSPSSSILKKTVIATPPSAKSNRVSFADPVVSGESPLREKYHSEQFSSPSCHLSSPGSRKRSSFGRSVSKRRLESSLRKESGLTRTHIARSPAPSPTPSPLSQSLKATPESQLDTVKPVYPSLVGCVTPLDSVLPQLTTSLWYRGLRQMMKGRNLHTVGDLSALTEVQVNQLPFRAPKVDTVRAALGTFMLQQGMKQGQGVLDELDPKDAKEKEESLPEIKEHNPLEVTSDSVASPANIADEGLRVRASDDAMLQSLSPIKVKNVLHRFVLLKAAESSPSPRKQLVFDAAEGNALTNHLTSLGQSGEALGLKDLDMGELMDLHTSINSLFSVVVDEMKSRCKPST